jgi:hypothetical protein
MTILCNWLHIGLFDRAAIKATPKIKKATEVAFFISLKYRWIS